jgi:hypothetical protein
MSKDLEEFINRILAKNRTDWWKNLKSETNKNKGRCLQVTLEEELNDSVTEYRDGDRSLFFFSSRKTSSIDGRYNSIGVEEKYNPLDLKEHLIDGSIHRGVIWVLGNPHNLVEPVEALSLYIVQDNSQPITSHDVDLYFPVIFSLFKLNIHILFINGKTGEYWRFDNDYFKDPLPNWLAEKEYPTIWDRAIDVVSAQNIEAIEFLNDIENLKRTKGKDKALPGFGKKGEYTEFMVNQSTRVAVIEYGNEWRLIEFGLLLRSAGYDAVKAVYNKQLHKNKKDQIKDKMVAGRGVEKRVANAMKNIFSVLLDWKTNLG